MSSPSKFLWNLNLLNLFDLFLNKERTPKSEIAYMILKGVEFSRDAIVNPMDVLLCFMSPCALCDLVFPHVWLCHYIQVCLI